MQAGSREGGNEEVRIAFKILEKGDWVVDMEVVVNPAEPSKVERMAVKYLERG